MKIRQFTSFFILLFLGLTLRIQAQSEDAIVGVWLDTDRTAQIEIFKGETGYEGKIIWMQNPTSNGKPLLDSKNSDLKLKTRPLLGLTILEGLEYEDEVWGDGEIYDPNSGKTYSCELKLRTDQILQVKGYLGFSFVGKTVEWTRIK